MLDSVISFIDNKLSESGIVNNAKGLAELKLIDSDNKTPSTFCLGEWTAINIDEKFTYHRINGDISFEELDDEQAVSCEPWISASIPMKFVICKSKVNLTNTIFDALNVSVELSMLLQTLNSKSLAIQIGADTITITPQNSDTDSYSVYDSEFKLEQYPEDYILVSIDYTIEITGSHKCINKICPSVV